MTDAENAALNALVEDVLARLAEHFDAVQILATSTVQTGDGLSTFCKKRGFGNWYARQGMAQEFVNEGSANALAERLNENTSEP